MYTAKGYADIVEISEQEIEARLNGKSTVTLEQILEWIPQDNPELAAFLLKKGCIIYFSRIQAKSN